MDLFFCQVGNAIEQRINAKMKSLKERATGIFKVNRSQSKTEGIISDDPMVSIPLAVLFHASTSQPLNVSACYFVTTNGLPGGSAIGDVSISLIASPSAFILSQGLETQQRFQNYLTSQPKLPQLASLVGSYQRS